MLDSVNAYDASYALYAAPRPEAVGTEFTVPESPLRSDSSAVDPVGDSVELTRDFPQLVVGQTYAPSPAEQARQVLALEDEAAGQAGLDTRDAEATGAETEVAIEEGHAVPDEEEESKDGANAGSEPGEKKANGEAMTEAELRQVSELANRDREVRAHEQAHKAVGGQYSGGISFEYQQGPDGIRYAVGGEVSIDTSAERDPAATISKMRQVKAAALAPADPSGQDRSVAAQAAATETEARQQLAREQAALRAGSSDEGEADDTAPTDAASRFSSIGDTANLVPNPYAERYENHRINSYHSVSGQNLSLPSNGFPRIDIVA